MSWRQHISQLNNDNIFCICSSVFCQIKNKAGRDRKTTSNRWWLDSQDPLAVVDASWPTQPESSHWGTCQWHGPAWPGGCDQRGRRLSGHSPPYCPATCWSAGTRGNAPHGYWLCETEKKGRQKMQQNKQFGTRGGTRGARHRIGEKQEWTWIKGKCRSEKQMESNRKREETNGTGQNLIKRQSTHRSFQGLSEQQMLKVREAFCYQCREMYWG